MDVGGMGGLTLVVQYLNSRGDDTAPKSDSTIPHPILGPSICHKAVSVSRRFCDCSALSTCITKIALDDTLGVPSNSHEESAC